MQPVARIGAQRVRARRGPMGVIRRPELRQIDIEIGYFTEPEVDIEGRPQRLPLDPHQRSVAGYIQMA